MLKVHDLRVDYYEGGRTASAIRGVSLTVAKGDAVALVGESGSGKSTLALSIMRMVRPPIGDIVGGEVWLGGQSVTAAGNVEMRDLLRYEIGFIPQDPTTALDPLFTVGSQVAEALRPTKRGDVERTITDLLSSLGLDNAAGRLKSYPHEFSGGMRQRVAMAIALAKEPSLLIADEPTTALDVTTQLDILRMFDRLRTERELTTLFVTHDLRVARLLCQDVAVMYAGLIVEAGTMDAVTRRPAHPYTRALLDATDAGGQPRTKLRVIPGQPPSLHELPTGCAFAARCPRADSHCRDVPPPVEDLNGVQVRCWKPVTS